MTTQIDELLKKYAERIQAWRKATKELSPMAISAKRNAVELYDALEQANKRIKEQDDFLSVIDEALGKIELKAGNAERGGISLVKAYKQANEKIVELQWLLQNEPPDDLGSYTQVMRQKWNKRRDKALAE